MKILIMIVSLLFPIFNNSISNAADEYERISTAEDFDKRIVGRYLDYKDGALIVFISDGTFGGSFSGSRVWGEWEWRDDRVCHQLNIGEKRYKVDCRIPEIFEKKVKFRRKDGTIYGIAKILGE